MMFISGDMGAPPTMGLSCARAAPDSAEAARRAERASARLAMMFVSIGSDFPARGSSEDSYGAARREVSPVLSKKSDGGQRTGGNDGPLRRASGRAARDFAGHGQGDILGQPVTQRLVHDHSLRLAHRDDAHGNRRVL